MKPNALIGEDMLKRLLKGYTEAAMVHFAAQGGDYAVGGMTGVCVFVDALCIALAKETGVDFSFTAKSITGEDIMLGECEDGDNGGRGDRGGNDDRTPPLPFAGWDEDL